MIKIKGNPISVNSLYRGRRFLTERGKDLKESNAWDIKKQWKKKPISGDVRVKLCFYFESNRRRDIDGPIKALLDAMSGIVYNDDSQIVELHVFKTNASPDPRVEIEII